MGGLALGLGLGGMGLSALGGLMGGQSSRTAAHQARDMALGNAVQGQRNLGSRLWGRGFTSDQDWTFDKTILRQNIPGQADDDSILGRMNALARTSAARGNELEGLARGNEDIALGFGKGANASIDEQTAHDLKAANAQTLARLNAMGLGGSTLATDSLGANNERFSRGARAQKVGVQQATTDRRMSARSARVGVGASNLERNTRLAQDPLNLEYNALNSSIMNPFLGGNTNQYFSGQSGAASAASGAAGTLGVLSGYGLSNGGFGFGGGSENPARRPRTGGEYNYGGAGGGLFGGGIG